VSRKSGSSTVRIGDAEGARLDSVWCFGGAEAAAVSDASMGSVAVCAFCFSLP
jgi:hypothetical protein